MRSDAAFRAIARGLFLADRGRMLGSEVKLMPAITGSFSGKVMQQTALALSDQPNHELNLAEITGTQKSSDEGWNGSVITYWGTTDAVDGKGTQRGYFVNVHRDGDRDWGTFEGKVASSAGQTTAEGTFHFTGGSGKYNGVSGGGAFQTKMSSPADVAGTWHGTYELASAKAQAR
jgi:hypothetical protein